MIAVLIGGSYSFSLGQSVIAADGGVGGTDKIRIEWTLGEFAIATLTTPNGLLTEGFHQPSLQVTRLPPSEVALHSLTEEHLKISMAPNPVRDLLNIKIEHEKDLPIHLRLLDGNGRVILQQKALAPSQVELNLSKYASGLYFLQFHRQDGPAIETYKISKH